ncbi:LysR family transcriptional regulator [Pseudoxanthomonas suwonensis]|uniref:LysR family transcriptional regulator n=1 Tax=Pseudoxanthomonas suwonensis TaxID=314722 RepID=UPI000465B0DF|nr:LysR family transcriptional regulator [Pseudoxanthomonas suwonensis]
MDMLRAMQVFVRVVELGSLSAAARERHTTQPTVSKLVAALEDRLGVRLLERSTTHVVPTEQGRRFHERARRLLEDFDSAVADARGLTETPAGLLRITAPVSLGVLRLNRLVQAFMHDHPGLEVELILNDRMVDLVEDGMDVAIRIGGQLPPSMVARKIAVSTRQLVAAPSYLQAHPAIAHPDDVAAHNYLRFAWASDQVELRGADGAQVTLQLSGRYRINNSLAIRDSLLTGAGIGLAPGWLVQDLVDAGQLAVVLPDWQAPPHEAFVLYPSRRHQPARVREFVRFIGERLAREPGLAVPG